MGQLQERINDLEARIQDANGRNERLRIELVDATLRCDYLEGELASERELRRSIEAVGEDTTLIDSLERMVARHSAALQGERLHFDRVLEEKRWRLAARLEAATIRHEQAVLGLAASHRREVSERLDLVLGQTNAIFARIANAIQDAWTTHGTMSPSPDKAHWFLLARDEDEEEDGTKMVTFKIHSGQRTYIDRIGREKDVVMIGPAANGIDIRQVAKKRMRDLTVNQDVLEFWLTIYLSNLCMQGP
jgi:hypothetical protein